MSGRHRYLEIQSSHIYCDIEIENGLHLILYSEARADTKKTVSDSYTMVCAPVRGYNPRALAKLVDYFPYRRTNHFITILYHPHQCGPCVA